MAMSLKLLESDPASGTRARRWTMAAMHDELTIVVRALQTTLAAIDEDEFATRLGVSREVAAHLTRHLTTAKSGGDGSTTVDLDELVAINGALNEVAHGLSDADLDEQTREDRVAARRLLEIIGAVLP
jgi:hypothetical protein